MRVRLNIMKLRGVWAGVGLLILLTHTITAAEPKRVLVLHSFGREFAPFSVFANQFRTELAEQSPMPVDFIDVPLASARYEQAADDGPMISYLQSLFPEQPPDLVVPVGGPAVRFAQRNRQRLFPATPMLLAAADQRHVQAAALATNDAIVGLKNDLPGMIDNILQVLPATTNVVVVMGDSPVEKFWVAEMRREFAAFTNRVGLVWFNELSFDEMRKRAAALPPRSAMFYGILCVDADGVPHEEERTLTGLRQVANAPLFGLFDFQFGRGIVGGPLISLADLSRTAAGVAVRILQGESPASFRPAPLGPGKPVFDWRELRRWGIRESDLPPGSVVQFHQPTFWELYRWQIAGAVAFVLLQTALIISLLSHRTKRRQGEAEATLIADISSKFVNLPANEVDREIMEAERRICEFLGLDVAALWQWLGESTDFFTLTHYSAQKGPQPPERMNAKEHFPWFQQQMLAGRIVAVSSLAELPAEAARDRESARQLGIKSNLTIPLTVGGEPPIGVLGLNTTRAERDWPDTLVKRLQLVAQIFANALARKRSDQALRASEELSRVTFEQAAVGIAHVGIDGRWLRVNDKLCAIVGYQRDELLKLNFRDITHPADLDANLNYVRQLLAGEIQTCTLEKRYLRKDRSVVWIELTVSLVRTDTGQPKYFISVVEDISKRKQAEEQLLQLRQQLWHADRVAQTGAITASLAHEINQPLAAILSNAQAGLRFMAGENFNRDEIREILTDIVNDDKRAGTVIRGLRTMLRRKETRREPILLANTIQEIFDLLRGELLGRQVERRLHLESDCRVVADKSQIQQVILNLAMNAIEAMNDQPAGQRQLQVTLTHTSAGAAQVAVRDSGPGIPADQQAKLFEAFWTTKEQGLGIGLPISRSIIESHGGRIWFANNPDRGVTFSFALPCQMDHTAGVR